MSVAFWVDMKEDGVIGGLERGVLRKMNFRCKNDEICENGITMEMLFKSRFENVMKRKRELIMEQKRKLEERKLHYEEVIRRGQSESRKRIVLLQQRNEMKMHDAEVRREDTIRAIRCRNKAIIKMVKENQLRLKAVRRIQLWWKKQKVIIKRVERVLNSDALSKIKLILQKHDSFESLSEHLCRQEVLDAANEIIVMTCLPPSQVKKQLPSVAMRQAKLFLTSLMIHAFSEEVLAENGHQDSRTSDSTTLGRLKNCLIDSAICLKSCLFSLQESLQSQVNINICIMRLRGMRSAFLSLFMQWKELDAKRISHDLMIMYRMVKANLSQVLAESARHENNNVENDDGLNQFVKGYQNQLIALERKARTLLKPDDFQKWKIEAEVTDREGNTEKVTVEGESKPQQKIVDSFARVKTPMEVHTENQLGSMKESITHLEQSNHNIHNLVHSKEESVYEILVSPEYKLIREEKPYEKNDPANVLMEESLQNNDFGFFIAVLTNINERLNYLTPNRKDLQRENDEILDAAFLKEKLTNNAFTSSDLFGLISFVGNRILSLQAAARTQGTNLKLSELQKRYGGCSDYKAAVPECLHVLLQAISTIEFDMANYQLSLLAERIKADNFREENIGVTYLKEKIQNEIKSGFYQLTDEKIPVHTARFIAEQKLLIFNRNSNLVSNWKACLQHGFADLLCFVPNRPSRIDGRYNEAFVQNLPETIQRFDAKRMVFLHQRVKKLSLLVFFEIIFCRFVSPETLNFKDLRISFRTNLKALMDDRDIFHDFDCLSTFLVSEIKKSVKLSLDDENSISSMLEKSNVEDEPVFLSMMRRFRKIIYKVLCSQRPELVDERDLNLEKSVFSVWQKEVGDISRQVGKMYLINTAVFEVQYSTAFSAL